MENNPRQVLNTSTRPTRPLNPVNYFESRPNHASDISTGALQSTLQLRRYGSFWRVFTLLSVSMTIMLNVNIFLLDSLLYAALTFYEFMLTVDDERDMILLPDSGDGHRLSITPMTCLFELNRYLMVAYAICMVIPGSSQVSLDFWVTSRVGCSDRMVNLCIDVSR